MKLSAIRMAANGFILTEAFGDEYIAKTLTEAAQMVGEFPSSVSDSHTLYSEEGNAETLNKAKRLWQNGYKVNAIRTIRACFSPKLGLKEAKQLLETFC